MGVERPTAITEGIRPPSEARGRRDSKDAALLTGCNGPGARGPFRIEVAGLKEGTGYTFADSGAWGARDGARRAHDYLRSYWRRLVVEESLEGHQPSIQ